MELDVDSLLIISLKQVQLEACQNLESVQDLLNPDTLISVAAGLLNRITNNDFPVEPPSSISARYKLCNSLSTEFKKLGYNKDIGFNVFLYPNLKDSKQLMSFAIEKLPKEEVEEVVEKETPQQAFFSQIKKAIKTWTSHSWTPPFKPVPKVQFKKVVPLEDKEAFYSKLSKGGAVYLLSSYVTVAQDDRKETQLIKTSSEKPQIKLETPSQSLPSLEELLQRDFGSKFTEDIGGAFALEAQFTQEDTFEKAPDTFEDKQKEIEELETTLQKANEETQVLESEYSALKEKLFKVSQELNDLTQQNSELKLTLEQKHNLSKALEENNPETLNSQIKELQEKLESLEKEWEEYKNPILQDLKKKELREEKTKEKFSDKIEEIKLMKEEMKDMIEEVDYKDSLIELYKQEETKVTTSTNRNLFIKTTTDIVSKLKTQTSDIAKVNKDLSNMQRSVEMVREALKRSDAATDDLVFQETKKNSKAKNIYQLLVEFRKKYESLIGFVEEQFKLQSSLRDLEIRIDSTYSRTANQDINKLKQDLQNIKAEQGSS
mmetsp:Transcript_13649/g.19944  ORF Transcript_13649/g.19944 Transcript_13649/m.19944 type:complete len:547 (+) Transcript_13649:6-1646(+)